MTHQRLPTPAIYSAAFPPAFFCLLLSLAAAQASV